MRGRLIFSGKRKSAFPGMRERRGDRIRGVVPDISTRPAGNGGAVSCPPHMPRLPPEFYGPRSG